MLNKNKIVRNVIFLLFCTLILIVSGALTYYVAFYDETNQDFQIKNIKDDLDISSSSESALESAQNQNKNKENNEDDDECDEDDDDYTDLIGGLFYKFTYAFIAGSLLSDKCFLKLGLI
jgi:hypothetical protein